MKFWMGQWDEECDEVMGQSVGQGDGTNYWVR